jgi:hypothetical protein
MGMRGYRGERFSKNNIFGEGVWGVYGELYRIASTE